MDLPLVLPASHCLWCGHSVPGFSDCTGCGAAQTTDMSGSPSDLDVPGWS